MLKPFPKAPWAQEFLQLSSLCLGPGPTQPPLSALTSPQLPCSQVWSLSVLTPPRLPVTGSTYHITPPEGPAAVAMGIRDLKGKTRTRPSPLLMPAGPLLPPSSTLQNAHPGWRQRGAPVEWMEPKGQRRRDEQKVHRLSYLLIQNPFISLSSHRCKARPKEICIFILFNMIHHHVGE